MQPDDFEISDYQNKPAGKLGFFVEKVYENRKSGMKIVNKIQLRKLQCGICLEKKIKIAKFNCRCALLVCKDCYIKCKLNNKNCPACRQPIKWLIVIIKKGNTF